MEQSANDAVSKDAQIILRKVECAGGMGHIAINTMNLLHFGRNSMKLLQLYPNPNNMLLEPPLEAFQERWPSFVRKSSRSDTFDTEILTKRYLFCSVECLT